MSAPKPVHRIEIGGQDRPVRFGYNALATFNDMTGTTIAYLQETFSPPPEVMEELEATKREALAEGVPAQDLTMQALFERAGVTWQPPLTAGQIRALAFAGLADGARKRGETVDFDKYDVGDWLDEDREAIQKIFQAFNAHQTEEEEPATLDDEADDEAEAGKEQKKGETGPRRELVGVPKAPLRSRPGGPS